MGDAPSQRGPSHQICSCLILAAAPQSHPDNRCRQSAHRLRIPPETQRRFCLGRPDRCPLLRAAWRTQRPAGRELDRSGRPVPLDKAAGHPVWARLEAVEDPANGGSGAPSRGTPCLSWMVAFILVLDAVIAGLVLGVLLTRPTALARSPESLPIPSVTLSPEVTLPSLVALAPSRSTRPLPTVTDTSPPSTATHIPRPTSTASPSPSHTPSSSPTSTPSPSDTPTATPGARSASIPPSPDPADPTATLIPGRAPAVAPPSRILAPSIGLDAPVEEVGWIYVVQDGREVPMWDVPDGAAGFHKTSAYPGQPGNTVLNGHRDIGGSVFLHLDGLQLGDPITLYVGQAAYAYHVAEIVIFQERDVSAEEQQANRRWIKSFPDERLTLVTCWPLGSNSHRLVVIAKPPGTS